MGPLLKITSVPYESVRITQQARLVPSDMVAVARQQALARCRSYQMRHPNSGYSDFDYANQVRRAFVTPKQSADQGTTRSTVQNSAQSTVKVSSQSTAPSPEQVSKQSKVQSGTTNTTADSSQASVSSEASSAYLVERGAFELRVAKGDVSYIPALTMTIVTQYPEVNFEYLGGFNYVPPSADPAASTVDTHI